MLAPLYIAEVAPAAIRGRLVSMNQLAIVLGILVSYLVGWAMAGLGEGSWRWMFAVAAVPSLFFFAALFFVPESPRWLVKEGRRDEGRANPGETRRAAVAAQEIERTIAEESGSMRQLLEKGLRRPLLIGVTLAILQQVTGINTVLYYGSIIFTEHAGAESTSAALWANVLVGAMNPGLHRRRALHHRPPGPQGAADLGRGRHGPVADRAGLRLLRGLGDPRPACCALILCYVACFSFGMGPGVWVVISELFPTRIRGRAMSLATVALWLACLLITLTFLSLVKAFTAAGAFWIYAVPLRLHGLVRLEVHARNEGQEPRGDRTAVEEIATKPSASQDRLSARRLAAALRHERPDRIPIDLGSTAVTGIHVSCVAALRDYYGLPKIPVKVHEPYQMLGWMDDDLAGSARYRHSRRLPPRQHVRLPQRKLERVGFPRARRPGGREFPRWSKSPPAIS